MKKWKHWSDKSGLERFLEKTREHILYTLNPIFRLRNWLTYRRIMKNVKRRDHADAD